MKKTNAARILDNLGIHYDLKEYEVDENDLGAENVAHKIGMPPEQVFKTLVVSGDKTGVFLTVVPGNKELDLKAVAACSGNKKVEMVPLKDVQKLTGYIRGGVSPIGTKKPYPVYLDETITHFPFIACSAGLRGCQFNICPGDLVKAVQGHVYPISREMVD
jgi:Cys-tRNA(Pro)/Cys-tRNA(Cys) deacylase